MEDRVHVEHILLKTVGKTEAESAEIQKQAEDVLKQAKKGANFEDLAKKYSEDTGTKEKGGDLGWIVDKQTVPEFQQAAFSLPRGSISDLVKTNYGFHIIKVLDKESAHTKTFEEVRSTIEPILAEEKLNSLSNDVSAQMASAIRQSNRQSLDDLAKKFDLQIGETHHPDGRRARFVTGTAPGALPVATRRVEQPAAGGPWLRGDYAEGCSASTCRQSG